MGEIFILDTVTSLPIPVERVLNAAKRCPKDIVVIGWDENDDLYCASSTSDNREVLWLLEMAKQQVLSLNSD